MNFCIAFGINRQIQIPLCSSQIKVAPSKSTSNNRFSNNKRPNYPSSEDAKYHSLKTTASPAGSQSAQFQLKANQNCTYQIINNPQHQRFHHPIVANLFNKSKSFGKPSTNGPFPRTPKAPTKTNLHHNNPVTKVKLLRGHPERTSQVRGRGGSAQRGQSKTTFFCNNDVIGRTRGGRGSKSPDFEGTSFMDAPLCKTSLWVTFWH